MLSLTSFITLLQRSKCHIIRCQDCGCACQTDIPTVCDPELLSRKANAYKLNGFELDEMDHCLITTGICAHCHDYLQREVDQGRHSGDYVHAGTIEIIGDWTTKCNGEQRTAAIEKYAMQCQLCISWLELSDIKHKALSEFAGDMPIEITHHIEITTARLEKTMQVALDR